jgi:hypothetical protein
MEVRELKRTPRRIEEDSRTDSNTKEASNRPLQTNHLKSGPTVQVNPFVDIEIISS